MIIELCPIRANGILKLEREGDVLTVNDVPFDLSHVQNGDDYMPTGAQADWFAAPVTRKEGRLFISLFFHHDVNAPQEALFPALIELERDGPVALPARTIETMAEEDDDMPL